MSLSTSSPWRLPRAFALLLTAGCLAPAAAWARGVAPQIQPGARPAGSSEPFHCLESNGEELIAITELNSVEMTACFPYWVDKAIDYAFSGGPGAPDPILGVLGGSVQTVYFPKAGVYEVEVSPTSDPSSVETFEVRVKSITQLTGFEHFKDVSYFDDGFGNALELSNGDDIYWTLSDPFVGSDPVGGDMGGDLYWKVFPADALRRCSGTSTLLGIRYHLLDQDWIADDATLWAFSLTESTTGTDGVIRPDLSSGAIAVTIPELPNAGLGNPNGPGGCPAPGYVSGWLISESFLDTTGTPAPLLADMQSDGTVDWSLVSFFPGGQSTTTPAVNSCGDAGNATLSWAASSDSAAGDGGEDQADVTGLGLSPYGGYRVGGTTDLVPETVDGGADFALLFAEPTLNMRVRVANGDGTQLPELGLAGLNLPLGDGSHGSTMIGTRLYDRAASPGTYIGLHAANVGPTLLDTLGSCLPFGGGSLGLNPIDPAFLVTLNSGGLSPYYLLDDDLCCPPSWDSNLLPLGTGPALIDAELHWQAFTVDLLLGEITGSSQILTMTLRE